MVRIWLDVSPLHSGHAGRGIGTYTEGLLKGLRAILPSDWVLEDERSSQTTIVHYPYFDLFRPSLPLSWSATPKRIVTIHDVIPLDLPQLYPVGLRGSIALAYQRRALKMVTAVITDSEASRHSITHQLGIPSERIETVFLAADQAFSPPSKALQSKIRTQYALPKQYLLYVGDINANKNLPELLSALAKVPGEIALVCIGQNFTPSSIPEWTAITERVARHSLHDRVQFITELPKTDRETLAAVYHQAECVVQPSLSEGFGLPVLEALQSGGVVVATRGGSLPEVGGQAVLYADGFGADALAEAINRALALSQSARKQLVASGLKRAAEFSWERTAQKTLDVYQKVLGQTAHA